MTSNLVIYLDYSPISHVITSERLKDELATFRVEVLKREFKMTWNPRLKKIPEKKGWLFKKNDLDLLCMRLGAMNLGFSINNIEAPLPSPPPPPPPSPATETSPDLISEAIFTEFEKHLDSFKAL